MKTLQVQTIRCMQINSKPITEFSLCSIAGKDNNKSFERKTDVNNQISEQREQRFNNRRVRDDRDNRDSRVNRDQRDNRDNRDNRENRENRENQPLNTSDGSAGNRKCPEKKTAKMS